MNMRNRLLLLFASVLLFSCSQPSDMDSAGLLDTEFYSFELRMEDNGGLAYDVTGTQSGNRILLKYPDYSVPGYTWIPRFSTDAATVEVDGVAQESGVSVVDFSGPVTYTLTADSGMIQQFEVELSAQPGWQDLGTNPLLAALFPSRIDTGFHLDRTPYTVFLENTGLMRAYALNLIDGTTWEEFIGGPAGMENFDSLYWNGQVQVITQTIGPGGNMEWYSLIPPNTWSGSSLITIYSGTASGFHMFPASSLYMFAAWIDDSADTKMPVVWVYDGAAWGQAGGYVVNDAYPGSTLHADSFRAVADNGSTVYAACTFAEAEGLIHLFKISPGESVWSPVFKEESIPFNEESRRIVDMFYDSEKGAPVVVTTGKTDGGDSAYAVKILYYDKLAAAWTNLNYIEPFYIPEADLTSLSLSWLDNKPSAAYGNKVLSWNGEGWEQIGSTHYADRPSVQSLSKGVSDFYMTALRDDGTGDLIARYFQ
ncbi:MAG: hypothetical protein PQJ58_10660 [Spirochaetales bacterium]|nr:hypothetical protein [Spirochaetales bacterium]